MAGQFFQIYNLTSESISVQLFIVFTICNVNEKTNGYYNIDYCNCHAQLQ